MKRFSCLNRLNFQFCVYISCTLNLLCRGKNEDKKILVNGGEFIFFSLTAIPVYGQQLTVDTDLTITSANNVYNNNGSAIVNNDFGIMADKNNNGQPFILTLESDLTTNNNYYGLFLKVNNTLSHNLSVVGDGGNRTYDSLNNVVHDENGLIVHGAGIYAYRKAVGSISNINIDVSSNLHGLLIYTGGGMTINGNSEGTNF